MNTKNIPQTISTKIMQIPSSRHVTKRVLCTEYFNRTECGNRDIQQN